MLLFVIIVFALGVLVAYLLMNYLFPSDNFFLRPIPPWPANVPPLDEYKIVKQAYDYTKIPANLDTIVLGGGIAGLATSSMLAQDGKVVLCLEQNEQLGGFTHQFKKEGPYNFPTGMHSLCAVNWENESNLLWQTIFDKASENGIEFKDTNDPVRRHLIDDKSYDMIKGKDNWLKYMKEKFPEKSDYDKVVELVKISERLINEMKLVLVFRDLPEWIQKAGSWIFTVILRFKWYKLMKVTLKDYVYEHFKGCHPDLPKIFTALSSGIGQPTILPCALGLSVLGVYLGGCCMPVEGGGMIARKITKVIRKYGSMAFCNARVSKILVDEKKKKVTGVLMENGDKITCPRVVSCVGLWNTYSLLDQNKNLFKGEEMSKFNDEWKKVKPSDGHFIVFCGLNKHADELGIPSTMVTIPVEKLKFPGERPVKDTGKDEVLLLVICRGDDVAPKGKGAVVILYQTPFSLWEKWNGTKEGQRPKEFYELGDELSKSMMDAFCEIYPGLKDGLEVEFYGSQLSTQKWDGWTFGESYGMKNDLERPKLYDELIRQNKIKNLYFGGMDRFPCSGVTSSIMSGLLAAQDVMGKNLLIQLNNANNIRMKQKMNINATTVLPEKDEKKKKME